MDEGRRITNILTRNDKECTNPKTLTKFIFPNNEHYIIIDGKYYKTLEEYFESISNNKEIKNDYF